LQKEIALKHYFDKFFAGLSLMIPDNIGSNKLGSSLCKAESGEFAANT
jgi:hypothetical protein